MVIGFVRGKELEQIDALAKAGCEKVFELHKECFDFLQRGDTLVVWRMDRFDYLLDHLARALDDLKARGVRFKSLDGVIDTATKEGETLLQNMMLLAEIDRTILRERFMAAARGGRISGRMHKAFCVNHDEVAKDAIEQRAKGKTAMEMAHKHNISTTTLNKWTKEYRRRLEQAELYKPLPGTQNAVAS